MHDLLGRQYYIFFYNFLFLTEIVCQGGAPTAKQGKTITKPKETLLL
jgi:hypothetical protein